MFNLSRTTEHLIGDLIEGCQRRKSAWPWSREAPLETLESMFDDLGRCAESDAVFWTVYGLAHPEPRVVAAAANAAARLLRGWSTKAWPRLDPCLRRRWIEAQQATPVDHQQQVAMVDRLPASGDGRVAGLVLLACHINGFVRQRAVEGLAAQPTAEALGVLTVRLDDWVEVIRRRTFEVWIGLLASEPVDVVVEALPLIWSLWARRRLDRKRLWPPVAELLSSRAGRRALLDGLGSSRIQVARAALTAILKLETRPEGWLPVALASADLSIQFHTARTLVAEAEHALLVDHLGTLFAAPFAPIRRLALDVCERHAPEQLEARAREGLFDRSVTIRRRCQETLVLDLDIDPLPIYRSGLEKQLTRTRCTSALFGLAETGDASDRPIFEAYVDSPGPRVRAAAVAGLGRVARPDEAEVFWRFLHDPSARVVRVTERILHRLRWGLPQLTEVYGQTESALGRRALVDLAVRLSGWDRILFLIDALRDPDPMARTNAQQFLQSALYSARGWGFGKPTPEQQRDLEARLRFPSELFGPEFDRQLRFILRLAGA